MKRLFFLTFLINFIMSPAAFAAVSDEDIAQLREQLAAMSERLDQLAAENAELRQEVTTVETSVAEVQAAGSVASAESWADRIVLDGDFRYRYESIDPEGSSDRTRNRIRARANIKAQVADNIDVGFGLATGGDDPVSTNQTLGGGGSSKGVVLNLAYVDWEVTDGLHLYAGKFKNPLTKAGGQPLMWDGDWTPEGLALKYSRDWYFVNAIGNYLESDTRKSNDNFSWGAQFGAKGQIGDVNLSGGLGFYSIKTAGEATTYGDAADPGDYFGNTAVEASGLPCGTTPDTDCMYLHDYELVQLFAEASFEVGSWPAKVFVDYVNNSDASDNDTGWALGTTFGQARDRGQKQFTYYYADKEADSTLGLLTDSDFGGGGTDSKGHWLMFNYSVSKSWTIGAQYFINETSVSSGSRSDYNRLMIDMQWKWK